MDTFFGGLHAGSEIQCDATPRGHHRGFHLDTHPSITADTGIELASQGVAVSRGNYQVVDLPANVERATLEIPPLENGVAFGLRFWASVIPHVGGNDEHGHFLVSYDAPHSSDPDNP